MQLAPSPQEPIAGLRQKAFSVTPKELGLSEEATGPVWGVIMETGYPQAMVSLVVFADGTTSLYFGNGGGIIGAGEHQSVRDTSKQLLKIASQNLTKTSIVTGNQLPHIGETRLYLLTYSGLQSAAAKEELLGEDNHELSSVFYAAHDVISTVRENTPEN